MCLRHLASPTWPSRCILLLWAVLVLWGTALAAEGPDGPVVRVLQAGIDSALSPVQADMLDAALAKARTDRADLVLLTLDTPGGSITVMRRMVKALLASPVPVAIWVAPSGAQAASAGVFMVAAAHYAAMAPQTTIGSASPVSSGGGDIGRTMQTKIKNDLRSFVRSLARSHQRNAEWYERAVTRAANLDAMEAARERVVDMVAVSREDLLEQIGHRGLPSPGGMRFFQADQVRFVPFSAGLRHGLLSWLLNPQIAYMLLLAGVAGLFFELTTPGAVLPGVLGSLCLLLALYALSVLPTNAAGVLFFLLGGVFFGLEIFITSFGLLGLAGLVSFFLGSVLLFRTDGLGGLPLSMIIPTVLGLSALLALIGFVVLKAQLHRPASGVHALVGGKAEVRFWQGNQGKVFIHGELWQAHSEEPLALAAGASVIVTAVEGMTLQVAPLPSPEASADGDTTTLGRTL